MPIPAEADHHIVCAARCSLSDALRAMLREGYMTTPDWEVAQRHTLEALGNLRELLQMHAESGSAETHG